MIERYSRPEMAAVWTAENRYRAWLEVELAVCDAWADLGVIPTEAVADMRAQLAKISTGGKVDIDVARIEEIERTTRHDVIAFLTWLEEVVGPAARHIHLGCTSSDILDTATALLIREAGDILTRDMATLVVGLASQAKANKGVLRMGRTHGVHAEPTSFGLTLAGFYAEFERDFHRLSHALFELRVGKISGAVGTYAFLSPELEKAALERLGLKPDEISTQIIQRDRLAELFTAIAILGGTIERASVELRHSQRTEVLELEEGFAKGQKGSSAMPHKKNPISAENLCGVSRLLRGYALSSLEDQALWHERDISHSSVERVILPDATILLDYALNRLHRLLSGLKINKDRMRANMDSSYGLYFSQRLLTALVEAGMPRQEAYETVQRLAMRSWESGDFFPDLARADDGIKGILGANEMDRLFDPAFYLRHEEAIFKRVFPRDYGDK